MGKIHIKKQNRGKLHKDLGVPKGEKIPASKLKVKSSDSPAVKKRKVFAQNAKKWHHAQDGTTLAPREQDYNDINEYHQALEQYLISVSNQNDDAQLPSIQPIPEDMMMKPSFPEIGQGPSVETSFKDRDFKTPSIFQTKPKQKKMGWGDKALAALSLITAAIPDGSIKRQYVRPTQSYNQDPFGTGSQAIAEDGITMSVSGYKTNSKDKNKPKLRIPSNQITMKGVPHPVIGTGSDGQQIVMMPGQDYIFPNAEYVDEVPLKAQGGAKVSSKNINSGKYINTRVGADSNNKIVPLPIYVDTPNDPRLRAYRDSLDLYNATEYQKQLTGNTSKKPLMSSPTGMSVLSDEAMKFYGLKGRSFGQRLKDAWNGTEKHVEADSYERASGKTAFKHDDKLKSNDIKVINYIKSLNNPNIYAIDRTSPEFYHKTIMPENYYVSGEGPINQSYKKPVQPVVYQKPQQKPTYKEFLKTVNPKYIGNDYNLEEAYNNLPLKMMRAWAKDPNKNHLPDTYKLPNHPTFSDESKYYKLGMNAIHWKDNKPVGATQSQEPKFKPASRVPIDRPGLSVGNFNPNIPKPNIQRAEWDSTKPTKWSFTYPTGSYNEHKTIYFPDEGSWDSFIKDKRMMSSQRTKDQGTATGYLKKGGKMAKKYLSKSYKSGGSLYPEGFENVNIEDGQFHHLSSDTLMLDGYSHADGGTDINFGGKTVEAEKGEPAFFDDNGNLVVAGNLINPITGNKFKKDVEMIAKKEKKLDKLTAYAATLLNNNDPYDKWGGLKFNSGNAMIRGAKRKSDELSELKNHLSELQEAAISFDIGKSDGTAQRGILLPDGRRVTSQQYARMQKQDSSKKEDSSPAGSKKSIAQKHNNPGNIMWPAKKSTIDWIESLGGKKGEYNAKLNNYYVEFPDLESGQRAMKELLFDRNYKDKTLLQASKSWTGGNAYPNLPKNLLNKKLSSMSEDERVQVLNAFTLGEDSKKYNWEGIDNKAGVSRTTNPEKSSVLDRVKTKVIVKTDEGQPHIFDDSNNYADNFNIPEFKRKYVGSDEEPLQFNQILPEIYAAATNQPEPVWMQQYNPELFQDTEISLQDRRNRITSQGRASRQFLQDNANAQAILAAQEYSAINDIDAEEFRINQKEAVDITNKNKALLNEAQFKNLQLADTQYTRQSKAKSNSKFNNQTILNSLSNKVLQNRLENRTLRVFENMYPDFRYDDNYNLQHVGNRGEEFLNTSGFDNYGDNGDKSTTVKKDGMGNIKTVTETRQSSLREELEKEELKAKKASNFSKTFSVQSMFNKNKNNVNKFGLSPGYNF